MLLTYQHQYGKFSCAVFHCKSSYYEVILIKHISIRFPFDWKNPVGYIAAIAALILLAEHMVLYIGCFLVLSLGSIIFEITLVKDLKHQLHSINKMAKHRKSRKDIYKTLSEFIEIHTRTKQLSVFERLCGKWVK